MNSGTTPSWVGTAIVAMTNTRRGPRPRNRSFENENPARVANSTTESEVMAATINELKNAGQNLMSASSTRFRFSRRFPCGMRDGIGFWAIVTASEDANRNAK